MVKSVTVPGKCYAISDGDRPGDPIDNERPGLVLILAGSVCSIFIYFWYISTVS